MSQRSFSLLYADQRYDSSSAESRTRFTKLRKDMLVHIDRLTTVDQENVSLNRSDDALSDHSTQQAGSAVRFEREILKPLQSDDVLWRRFEKRFLMQGDFEIKALPIIRELNEPQRMILAVLLAERVAEHAQKKQDLNSLNTLMRLLDCMCKQWKEEIIKLEYSWLCRLKLIMLCESKILQGVGL